MIGYVVQRALARVPLVALVALACAGLAAAAVSSVISARYLVPATNGPRVLVLQTAAPVVVVKPTTALGRDLVGRDMFCSSCDPIPEVAGPDDTFTPQAVLIATMIGIAPWCTVRATDAHAQGDYGLGAAIPGVGTITRIGVRSIDLVDATGRHGHLDLLDTVAAARGDGAATPSAAAAAEPWEGRIHKIDDHTFEVDRDLVRELVTGGAKPGATRILPRTDKTGKLTGLRVFGVKADSLGGALGLANGDVLTGVNNVPITSAQTLLDVYAKIDSLNVVELAGERAEQPMTITLRLR